MASRKLHTIEVITIVDAYREMGVDAFKDFSIKVRWNIRKNIGVLEPTEQQFMEFRKQITDEVTAKYFTDECSTQETVERRDENGKPVLNENGDVEMVHGRQLKPEYVDAFNKEIAEINKKIDEILAEENEYELSLIDLDALVEALPEDTNVTMQELELLRFMDVNEK